MRLAGVAAVLVIGLVLFFIFRSDDDGPRSGGAALSDEAKELTELSGKDRDLTYHAVYRITGAQPTGGSFEIEIWRKNGRGREDQEVRSPGRVLRTSGFRLKDGTITCVRQDDKPWECQRIPLVSPDATPPPNALVAGVLGDLTNKDVKARDDEVDGREARCFTVGDAAQSSELCFTEDGIPLVLRTAQATMELIQLEDEVDDEVFDPPADVAVPGANP